MEILLGSLFVINVFLKIFFFILPVMMKEVSENAGKRKNGGKIYIQKKEDTSVSTVRIVAQ